MIQKYTPVLINQGFKTESAVMVKSTCGEYIKYIDYVKAADNFIFMNVELQTKELENDQVIEGLTKENYFLKLDTDVLLRANKLLADKVLRLEKELTIVGDRLNQGHIFSKPVKESYLSEEMLEYLRNR